MDIGLSLVSDYEVLSSSPVSFGSSLVQTVRINIANDDFVEPTEMFRVRLSSTNSDVMIAGQDFADVTITDSDSKYPCVISDHL